jgi:dTDP-4-dehydrorhamnose reductase
MSTKMKVLLLGKNGQLGYALQRSLASVCELVALDRCGLPGLSGEFSEFEALAATVRAVRPQVIVNAAAYTHVDRAESEPEQARVINALAPGVLAREAHALGAWLVHYSTDYVFDGSGTRPWRETDSTVPLNVYGRTKFEGEQLIQHLCSRHLIFRTSWVHGAHGSNFAKTMVRLAQERERICVVNDQWGAPTGADFIAQATTHAIQRATSEPHAPSLAGVYHLAAAGHTTWHAYASHVIQHIKELRPDIRWTVNDIVAAASSDYASVSVRPLNSRLDTFKAQTTLGVTMPSWQSDVERMLAQIAPGLSQAPLKVINGREPAHE